MDAKMVREWRAGYEAVNRANLEEARARTPKVRFQNLLRFTNSLSAMGLLRDRSDDLEYHLRWQRVRERWLEQHAGS